MYRPVYRHLGLVMPVNSQVGVAEVRVHLVLLLEWMVASAEMDKLSLNGD